MDPMAMKLVNMPLGKARPLAGNQCEIDLTQQGKMPAWPMPLTTHVASATRKPLASPMPAVANDQTAANSAIARRLPHRSPSQPLGICSSE